MTYQVALNFEDGVTRVIECKEDETVLDAAYRNHVKLPMDCSDGVCGTCKGTCQSGAYELGDEYIDEALTDDEAANGMILTCQMTVKSNAVVSIPAMSSMCQSGPQETTATVTAVDMLSDSTVSLKVKLAQSFGFLAGQYVNLGVPGTDQTRAYSFSSKPGEDEASFLIRNVPNGLMSTYLTSQAKAGDEMKVVGPMGSFYLREVQGPTLLLAGGTGLAPLLSMLQVMADNGNAEPIHLLYGVNTQADLVELATLDGLTSQLANFTYTTVVVDEASGHSHTGYVTAHMDTAKFDINTADVYLCGPPPMVEAVRQYLDSEGLTPKQFYYEKFNPST